MKGKRSHRSGSRDRIREQQEENGVNSSFMFAVACYFGSLLIEASVLAFSPPLSTHSFLNGKPLSTAFSSKDPSQASLLFSKSAGLPIILCAKRTKDTGEEGIKAEQGKAELLQTLEEKFNYEGRIKCVPGRQRTKQQHRCGFISLIGAPNMGKSTLLNALLQEKLCTATHRPQTTRHAILGVLTSHDDTESPCQLCFQDTPGVIGNPAYKLQEGMMDAVKNAFYDSDVIVIVTDLFSTPLPDDKLFHKVASMSSSPKEDNKTVIVAVNKIDLAEKVSAQNLEQETFHTVVSDGDGEEMREIKRTITKEDAVKNWRELMPNALAIIPLTASNGGLDAGVVALRTLLMGGMNGPDGDDVPRAFRELGRPIEGMFRPGTKFINDEEAMKILPVGPPLYDEDTLTDRNERFFASEIIRGTLFTKLGKELPYCSEVRIEEFREPRPGDRKRMIQITADICVERDSQKGIVVGKGGQKIKDVGIEARKELEEFLQEKVRLITLENDF